MRDVKKPLWIKERIENKEIKVEFEHATNFKYAFENFSADKIFEDFIHVFHMALYFCEEEQLNLLKEGKLEIVSEGQYCFECGEYINFVFDGTTIKETKLSYNGDDVEKTKIPCKKVGTYSFDINFPTGTLICTDWFPYGKELLLHLDNGRSINSNLGIYERSQKYAELNLVHMFVGNTCPSVYYKDGTLLVGRNGYDEDNDKELSLMEDGEYMGYICTDLWWASIVDAEIYKKLLIDKFGEEESLSMFNEIEMLEKTIKPGKYRCTYLKNEENEDSPKPNVFIKMEWIGNI